MAIPVNQSMRLTHNFENPTMDEAQKKIDTFNKYNKIPDLQIRAYSTKNWLMVNHGLLTDKELINAFFNIGADYSQLQNDSFHFGDYKLSLAFNAIATEYFTYSAEALNASTPDMENTKETKKEESYSKTIRSHLETLMQDKETITNELAKPKLE
ncbi:hypothetical protein D5R81_04570 [Parashewanella spongiae]|uniref:Uncharacterized protein n=1 Tax=Parashewanella spongiae TaxID=342950 RepID=A0A3A6ULN1_9GAMM|nr:hypothetical protein [Parashewanella spongiae]MCL1077324.1 hypothetical protein [Parashewanella spongiae]RJY18589.1 hypothetical protein D5R81_04570 [Parashewanella spongiae]